MSCVVLNILNTGKRLPGVLSFKISENVFVVPRRFSAPEKEQKYPLWRTKSNGSLFKYDVANMCFRKNLFSSNLVSKPPMCCEVK